MAPGGPPGSGRGRGGKFKKYTRGGGKHFSRDLRPLDNEGNEIKRATDKDSSSEEDNSSEESDNAEETVTAKSTNLSREERRAAAREKKEAAIVKKNGRVVEAGDLPTSSEDEDDDHPMPANPNHSKASRNQAREIPVIEEETQKKNKDPSTGATGKSRPVGELSRREREAIQAQQAKERYQKLHEAGKTDEARADLARLKLIREKRETDAARKRAEKEEREESEKAKKIEMNAREAKRREAALGSSKKGSSKK